MAKLLKIVREDGPIKHASKDILVPIVKGVIFMANTGIKAILVEIVFHVDFALKLQIIFLKLQE